MEELPSVLWAYHTTAQSYTQETPFQLTYGAEEIIPVEVGEPSWRRQNFDPEQNQQQQRVDLDLLQEERDIAHITEAATKLRASRRHNAKVLRRKFQQGDLVLKKADIQGRHRNEGKLAPNWEGPYRVTDDIGKGAYQLSELTGSPIPKTWNAANLRRYYS